MAIGSQEALKSAVGALKLKDIVLHEARFSRPNEADSETPAQELVKRAVAFKRIAATDNAGECLRILVGLGVRFAGVSESSDGPIFLEIEADFVAEYEVKSELTEEAITAFAGFNAVHNVWPFWRQHVYDVVNRGRLAPIDIPLYSGNPIGGVSVSEVVAKSQANSKPGKSSKVKKLVARRRQRARSH
jgi:hypothetical protein